MHDDDVYLRDRIIELEARLDARDEPSEGTLCALVCTTKVATYPSAPNAFYAVNPVGIDGVEKEGNAATYTIDGTRVFYVYNLGVGVPPQGTYLIVTGTGGRFTVRYDDQS